MELLTFKEVKAKTTLSASTIRRLESQGNFPKKIKLTGTSVRWKAEDINKWIETRPTA